MSRYAIIATAGLLIFNPVTFGFFLAILALYAGSITVPMVPLWASISLIAGGDVFHIWRERKRHYARWRNEEFYGCGRYDPISASKALWVEQIGNGACQLALAFLGFFNPLWWVGLAAWMGIDSVIHLYMKAVIGGDPPGYRSACWVLLPTVAFHLSVTWPGEGEVLVFSLAGAAGSVPLLFNYLRDGEKARALHLSGVAL